MCIFDLVDRFYYARMHSAWVTQNTRVGASVAVLAEIPVRSPQKIFIFIIKNIYIFVVSKNTKIK